MKSQLENKGLEKRGYLFLALCIICVLFFILYAGPFLEPYLGLTQIGEEVDRRDIKANMYFYSEVDQFYEAQAIMTNSRDYPSAGHDKD